MHDLMPDWLLVLTWIGVGFIVLVALVTLIRAPGRKQDPGRPENRPPEPEDEP